MNIIADIIGAYTTLNDLMQCTNMMVGSLMEGHETINLIFYQLKDRADKLPPQNRAKN